MSNTFNIKRTETNGDGVALYSVAHPRPTSKIDLIINALQKAKDGWQCFDEYEKALAAARELKALKPVAWQCEGRLLNKFDASEYLVKPTNITPLYALEVTK